LRRVTPIAVSTPATIKASNTVPPSASTRRRADGQAPTPRPRSTGGTKSATVTIGAAIRPANSSAASIPLRWGQVRNAVRVRAYPPGRRS
jgi:hypothetical protein